MQPEILNTRPHSYYVSQPKPLLRSSVPQEAKEMFKQTFIGAIAEGKENNSSFNVTIKVKLTRVTNKDNKKILKTIQLRSIDNCRFNTSSLEKLASNLDDDQYKMYDGFTWEKYFYFCEVQECISI